LRPLFGKGLVYGRKSQTFWDKGVLLNPIGGVNPFLGIRAPLIWGKKGVLKRGLNLKGGHICVDLWCTPPFGAPPFGCDLGSHYFSIFSPRHPRFPRELGKFSVGEDTPLLLIVII